MARNTHSIHRTTGLYSRSQQWQYEWGAFTANASAGPSNQLVVSETQVDASGAQAEADETYVDANAGDEDDDKIEIDLDLEDIAPQGGADLGPNCIEEVFTSEDEEESTVLGTAPGLNSDEEKCGRVSGGDPSQPLGCNGQGCQGERREVL